MAKPKPLPPVEYIRKRLHYDPITGLFTWLIPPLGPTKPGDKAGWVGTRGYIYLMIDHEVYRAHRVAWLYMTSEEPPTQIDHEDLNTGNNAWSNLRAADHSQNKTNTGLTAANTSGLKGACFDKWSGRWRAMIRKNGRLHNLGSFDTAEEAHRAYVEAAKVLHGDFARVA